MFSPDFCTKHIFCAFLGPARRAELDVICASGLYSGIYSRPRTKCPHPRTKCPHPRTKCPHPRTNSVLRNRLSYYMQPKHMFQEKKEHAPVGGVFFLQAPVPAPEGRGQTDSTPSPAFSLRSELRGRAGSAAAANGSARSSPSMLIPRATQARAGRARAEGAERALQPSQSGAQRSQEGRGRSLSSAAASSATPPAPPLHELHKIVVLCQSELARTAQNSRFCVNSLHRAGECGRASGRQRCTPRAPSPLHQDQSGGAGAGSGASADEGGNEAPRPSSAPALSCFPLRRSPRSAPKCAPRW